MNFFKKLLHKNSPYTFLTRFVFGFFILYLFFPFYRGITGPGGIFYSPFLDDYLDIVKGLTQFLTGSARVLLEALQYHVVQNDYQTLRIGYSRGVIVNPSCLGWAVMSFWAAFVLANSGNVKHKLKWLFLGLASIITLNIVRVAVIALANHLNWIAITSLDHHQTFNIAAYAFLFVLVWFYIRVQKSYERSDFERKQAKHKLSRV